MIERCCRLGTRSGAVIEPSNRFPARTATFPTATIGTIASADATTSVKMARATFPTADTSDPPPPGGAGADDDRHHRSLDRATCLGRSLGTISNSAHGR